MMERSNVRRGTVGLLAAALMAASGANLALAQTPPPALTAAELTSARQLAVTIEAAVTAALGSADEAAILAAIEDSIVDSGVSPAVAKEALAIALASLKAKNLASDAVVSAFEAVGKIVQAAIDSGSASVQTASTQGPAGRNAGNAAPASVNGGGGGGAQHTLAP